MISLSLAQAADAVGARLLGPDAAFRGVSTDTRTLAPGELFVALKGERHDSHEMLVQAAARGAVAAVVDRPVDAPLPCLQVADTRRALGLLAHAWRNRCDLPVIAITGSNGKTGTKEMTAAILRTRGTVLATEGNLNNDIGVPQTLFRLSAAHEFAVIEMGANRLGDIADLVAIARPSVGVVTMCGPAHLQGFGTLAGVARAKGQIYERLGAAGVAVINADDRFAGEWRAAAGAARIIEFSVKARAEFSASDVQLQTLGLGVRFMLGMPQGRIAIDLPLDGVHNVANALAAAAAAHAVGADLEAIKAGLEAAPRVPGRFCLRRGCNGLAIVDDTYNANPASLSAAMETVALRPGRRWLLLGDMAELGPGALEAHRQAGIAARALGFERLFALGDLAREAARAFGSDGTHYASHAEVIAALSARATGGVTLLAKGSRMMQLDRVVEALLARESQAC